MKKNLTSDSPEDIKLIVESSRSFMDSLIENITELGAKIEAERERRDNLHRARMNKLHYNLERQMNLFAESKQELEELRQRNFLMACPL